MEQSSVKTVSYAAANGSLMEVVGLINTKLAELAEAGITVAPEHIHYSVALGEHGPRYLGNFSYLTSGEVPA